jgi:hypothetical protein
VLHSVSTKPGEPHIDEAEYGKKKELAQRTRTDFPKREILDLVASLDWQYSGRLISPGGGRKCLQLSKSTPYYLCLS